jgi:serine/threonine protein kinase
MESSSNDNTTDAVSSDGDDDEDKGEYEPPPPTKENTTQKCLPSADWQTQSFLNCNQLHEIDVRSETTAQNHQLLGQGWFRSAWKYTTTTGTGGGESVVLKTLRLEREFLPEYFELHRRDATAMERLTFSPFVYGYCGQSALNELADFQDSITSLEQLNRRMRGKQGAAVELLKLRLALSVTVGLVHVHNVNQPRNNLLSSSNNANQTLWDFLYDDDDHDHTTTIRPAMAHYDINPRNIAITKGGKPKLNDFNIAEFLHYNPTTNETCGFRSRLHEPWWRAPEEMDLTSTAMVNEKVDVYALGNVLFHILTTHAPRGKMKRERMDSVRDVVRQGIRPALPEPFASDHKSVIVKAFRQAMDLQITIWGWCCKSFYFEPCGSCRF